MAELISNKEAQEKFKAAIERQKWKEFYLRYVGYNKKLREREQGKRKKVQAIDYQNVRTEVNIDPNNSIGGGDPGHYARKDNSKPAEGKKKIQVL